VTVTTVGYGDFFPVTTPRRITAGLIMGIGLLTLAMVTAQVASSFVTQAPSRVRRKPEGGAGHTGGDAGRTRPAAARIEQLLTATSPSE
jgi:voltage-gated potassium channel